MYRSWYAIKNKKVHVNVDVVVRLAIQEEVYLHMQVCGDTCHPRYKDSYTWTGRGEFTIQDNEAHIHVQVVVILGFTCHPN